MNMREDLLSYSLVRRFGTTVLKRKGAVVTLPVIATAVAISCGIGILFGFDPARNASLMNPIAALRHE